jgi:hypothetical protein
MNGLFQFIHLLGSADDLSRTMAVGIALIVAALFYRFFENLFDVFGVKGNIRRLFIAEWAEFEESMEQAGLQDDLCEFLRSWVQQNYPRQVSELLSHRQTYEHCISQLVSSASFQNHGAKALWLEQLKELREKCCLRPSHGELVWSSRELETETPLILTDVHPDFENVQERDELSGLIRQLDDQSLTVDIQGREHGFEDDQDIWVRFIHGRMIYRFQCVVLRQGGDLLTLSHGRFLIQEKRGDPRVKHKKDMKICWYDGENSRVLDVESIDVSRSGVALSSASLVPLKTFIQLDLPLSNSQVLEDLEAEILDVTPFSQGLVRLHCRLISPDVSETRAIDEFIEAMGSPESLEN